MNKLIRIILGVVVMGCLWSLGSRLLDNQLLAQENEAPVDLDKVRTLMQKQQAGQQLTPEESAYLERARRMRRQGGPQNGQNAAQNRPRSDDLGSVENLLIKQQSGDRLTVAEEAQVEEARQRFRNARSGAGQTVAGFQPLIEMSAGSRYKAEEGGLYGAGLNVPPQEHQTAAEKALARIRPLDDQGNPNPNGKIVLLSIGMSNTTQEFSFFKRFADQSPLKHQQLAIVDAAQGGRAADDWARGDAADPRGRENVWSVVAQRLQAENVTPQQVQTIWLKQALRSPSGLGEHPEHTRKLQAEMQRIVQIAQEKFPNLRVIYLSSRIYAGYATSQLNPEPYAYESAFAVRGLIQDQIAGRPELNYDPAKGEVKAPVLLWGPYLWGNGMTPRANNGLVWEPEDFMQDGTHPSPFGRAKVSRMLYDFFTTSPYARSWFVKPEAETKG